MVNRKSSNRQLVYHLLPVAFWLLAIGGSVMPLLLSWVEGLQPWDYVCGYWVAVMVLAGVGLLRRIDRHGSSIEESFVTALLIGTASYWLPSVVVLLIPICGYLIWRNLFSMRAFSAMGMGLVTVAAWMAALHYMNIIHYPLSFAHHLWAWIPAGAILLAWLGTTIVRQTLRER